MPSEPVMAPCISIVKLCSSVFSIIACRLAWAKQTQYDACTAFKLHCCACPPIASRCTPTCASVMCLLQAMQVRPDPHASFWS